MTSDSAPPISPSERAFYADEFRGSTLVITMAGAEPDAVQSLRSAADTLSANEARLVLVSSGDPHAVAAALPTPPVVLADPGADLADRWLADLWLAITDRREVVVLAPAGEEAAVGARLAVAVRALKLVVTDELGGWGRPPRSFADVVTHATAFEAQLAERQGGGLVAALKVALAGGVMNVNLCRPADVDRELFTFDGSGTLFTSGGYVKLDRLRVDDLPAVERLVQQGVDDGLLRPRDRGEVARLAVSGLGARVVGSGHLAGMVSLETEPYADHLMGEVACLYTVSRFSGSGAGALLLDGLVEAAGERGLQSVFAVTVSDAASAFFARRGFAEVGQDQVPDAKWQGYDPSRRAAARVFLQQIPPPGGQPSLGF